MGDFRRVVTALACLLVFAGLAAAQLPLSCTATAAVPPQIRTEGITELVGDIVLQCQNGTFVAANPFTNVANITVYSTAPITSRILSSSTNQTEALLMIDEPVAAVQVGCANPQTSCAVNAQAAGTATTPAISPNVYSGILVAAQAVTFFNVPIVPPATAGGTRTYRITNVRIDGTKAGGNLNTPGQVIASVSITGSSSVPLNNPNQIVAFAQPGLTGAISPTDSSQTTPYAVYNPQQCVSQNDSGTNRAIFANLAFTENFGTAFKYRSLAGNTIIPTNQNVPGQVANNTESGFVYNGSGIASATLPAGFADSGTRLKATFNNVPAGVRIYVPSTNRFASNTNTTTLANAALGSASYAVYVPSETFQFFSGYTPAVTGDGLTGLASSTAVGGVVEVPITNGSGTAVWEVVNSTTSVETFTFPIALRYTASPATNSPATGLAPATVTLTFAPTGSTAVIPRFSTGGAAAQNLFQVTACRTILMYPYVTNQVGFDTGLAIANTSTDPFGTLAQAGTCTLNFYGAAPPNQPFTTPQAVASGSVYTTMLSTVAPGFQGYIIAICNFQYAHGFAFISDKNAINLAMGYLALVVPDPGTGTRPARSGTGTGSSEVLAY